MKKTNEILAALSSPDKAARKEAVERVSGHRRPVPVLKDAAGNPVAIAEVDPGQARPVCVVLDI